MTRHRSRKNLTALSACLLGLAVAPAASPAAETTTNVTATVSSELSVGVSTPPATMLLSRSTPGASTAVLDITSTTPWTVTVHDAAAGTPGHMDEVDCVTRAAGTGSLAGALKWENSAGATSGSLSGTPATVATGDLLGTVTVDFEQSIGASEEVAANDCYQLTTTFTVS